MAGPWTEDESLEEVERARSGEKYESTVLVLRTPVGSSAPAPPILYSPPGPRTGRKYSVP